MCGITGYVLFNQTKQIEHIKNMVDALDRRGPDSKNFRIQENYLNTYSLGHTRLSIIDVSSLGSQPMENNNYIIIIYYIRSVCSY